jgi:hypothetical protein
MARGESGKILVETQTGIVITRGYSMEPDVLFDLAECDAFVDLLPTTLRELGYNRVRDFRWSKRVGAVDVSIDLFHAGDVEAPTGMTVLPSADQALGHRDKVKLTVMGEGLELAIPNPAAFVAMRVEAKRTLRPSDNRDCFDLYTYLVLKTPRVVAESLTRWDWSRALIADLRELFGFVEAAGVRDVLDYAGTLEPAERALVARDVVDRFNELFQLCGE